MATKRGYGAGGRGIKPPLSRAAVFVAGRRDPKTRRDKPGLETVPGERGAAPASPMEARAGLVNASGLTNGRGLTNGKGLVNGRDLVGGKRTKRGAVTGRKTESALAESAGFLDAKGLTNGKGLVNGAGLTNGKGLVNGRRLMYSEAQRERRRRFAGRTTAIFAALMAILVVFGPILYSSVFASAPVTVDGDFSDWVGWPVVEETASDMADNPNINIVGVSARASDKELFFYVQVTQAGRPFSGPPGSSFGAESFRILIDRDKSPATGYCAFGLGAEYMIELSGYNGRVASSSLKSFPAASGGTCTQRAEPALFQTAGLARSAVGGNRIEGAVRLSDLGGMRATDNPFMLAVAQDSEGNMDVGDVVFSSLPGLLVVSQTPGSPGAGFIPSGGETLLLSLGARAYFTNLTLFSFNIFVDSDATSSPGGSGAGGTGCVVVTRVLINGQPRGSAGGSACGGQIIQVNIGDYVSQTFNYTDPPKSIDIYGRSTGVAGAAVVRLYLRGASDLTTTPIGAAPGTISGHGSVLPPLSFSFFYVGGLPGGVRIDGAFSDWDQFGAPDSDPDNDVSGSGGGPTGGGPNSGGFVNQNVDVRASRADVNSAARTVSFFLQVDGSIMGSSPLSFPSYPRPSEPSTGGGGSAGPNEDIAKVYVDTDSNATTGWRLYAGLGVDAVVEFHGNAGGYGRQPRVTTSIVSTWNVATLNFQQAGSAGPVGLDSTRMEAQVTFAQLCFTNCGRVRYVFSMTDAGSHSDETGVKDGTFRGGGDTLFFEEKSASTRNAFQGDRNVPVLTFSLASPASNEQGASIAGFGVRFAGATPQDITGAAIYRDRGVVGQWDEEDLAVAPIADGTLGAGGFAELSGSSPFRLAPGERLDAIVVVDIGWQATADTRFTASIALERGIFSTGVVEVSYAYPAEPSAVRIFDYMPPGTRASANLVLNELIFISNIIEIKDTSSDTSVSLTSPQISVRVYGIDDDLAVVSDQKKDFSGSTNSDGFAVVTLDGTLNYSSDTVSYTVLLRCATCGAGGANKTLDSLSIPQGTARGAYGRFTDGTGGWRDTDNNTSNTFNTIPEFTDAVVPVLGLTLAVLCNGWRRRNRPTDARAAPP